MDWYRYSTKFSKNINNIWNIIKNKLYNLVEISEFLALKSQETNEAFLRFVELNKDDFLDLKGGAKLEKLITEIYNAAKFFINEKQKFSTVISRNSKIHNLCEFNEQLPLLEKIAQYKGGKLWILR